MRLSLLFSVMIYLYTGPTFADVGSNEPEPGELASAPTRLANEQNIDPAFLIGVSKNEIEELIAVEIRTGGDTVYCQETGNDSLQGYYALDSLVYKGSRNEITVDHWESSLLRIVNQLSVKMPLMAKSLNEFIIDMENPLNLRQQRIWWPVDNLKELKKFLPNSIDIGKVDEAEFKDSDLLTPPKHANCYHKDELTEEIELNTLQTVIRRQDLFSDRIVYLYRPEILEQLSPLQRSYLIIHEWLWDFYSRGQINDLWMINQFLHSQDFEQMDAEGVWDVFKNLNIPISFLGSRPSFSETQLGLGETFSCLLHKNKLRCWGKFKNSEWKQPDLKAPSSLAASRDVVCVIDEGKVKCWGDNNPEVEKTIEIMSEVRDPIRLVSSLRVMCAISLIDGTVCSTESSFPPYLIRHIYTMNSLEGLLDNGNSYGCIIGMNEAVCEGPTNSSYLLQLKKSEFRSIAMHLWKACFINESFETYCWSSGGKSSKLDIDLLSFPTAIAGANHEDHLCFINDFTLACNREFKFDLESKYNYMPTQVYKPKLLRGSGSHFCVLDELGVKCWGRNDYGQSEVPPDLYPLEP